MRIPDIAGSLFADLTMNMLAIMFLLMGPNVSPEIKVISNGKVNGSKTITQVLISGKDSYVLNRDMKNKLTLEQLKQHLARLTSNNTLLLYYDTDLPAESLGNTLTELAKLNIPIALGTIEGGK
ncbi:hypothetical protein [Maridesulfovibrio zosterae]|uniref:hypothetical protein n=1 Tax=Maridesulfovibrio zosterae TaxID=82171 RepID=UPI00040BCEFF|nr:hypothetical protein [Maridesulfovibrio zosterae]